MRFVRSFVALLAVVLLVGCSAGKSEPQPQSQESGSMTMGELLSTHLASWNEFNEGVRSGEQIPQSLELYVSDTVDGYVYDKDVIASFWNRLSQLRVDAEHPVEGEGEGSRISFSFDSGKEVITYGFRTTEYAELHDKTRYAMEDPSALQKLVDELKELVAQEMPKEGSELQPQNGAYFWDATGDGMLEHMWIDVTDNGDEAPSVMNVRVFGEDLDTSAIINGGYSVNSVTLNRDDQGPYVVLDYNSGDYYSHDTPSRCVIRVVGDELRVEDASVPES